MKKYVIGIGEARFDCLPEGRKLGGAPANFSQLSEMTNSDER